MQPVDVAIVVAYLLTIVVVGLWFSRKQQTTRDYLLGGKRVPWYAVVRAPTHFSGINSF